MASGRMASIVVPSKQSKRIYTNSSGGAATVNFYGQALCNTANSSASISIINNCCVDPTSVVTTAISVPDCYCCDVIDEVLQYYINPSDNTQYMNVQVHRGSFYKHNSQGFYTHPSNARAGVPNIYPFDSSNNVMLPEAWNGGTDTSTTQDQGYANYLMCDCTSGACVKINNKTYSPIVGKRKTGWVFPSSNCVTCPDPCANYVMGLDIRTCDVCNGQVGPITVCCGHGCNNQMRITRACCFNGLDPQSLFKYQFRNSCCAVSGVNSIQSIRPAYDYIQGNCCYCKEHLQQYVAFDPVQGTAFIWSNELDSDGYCCECSLHISWHISPTSVCAATQANLNDSVWYYNCGQQAYRMNCDATYGKWAPFFVSDGIAIRSDHVCQISGCSGNNGIWWYVYGYGNQPSSNEYKALVMSGNRNDRCCGCAATHVCVSTAQTNPHHVRWLMKNDEAEATYVFWGDCGCGWGGIYQLDMENLSSGTSSACCNIDGPISDPLVDTALFCCKVKDITELPLDMQYLPFNFVLKAGQCCYLALVDGCHLYRSPNLYEWEKTCDFYSALGVCFVQYSNNSTRCFFTTENTTLCRADNIYTSLPCTGMIEYCFSFNNYSNGGIVLSNNDSIYIDNKSTVPFSFQVWGYEDS